MLFLMDSFVAPTDSMDNPRRLIRVLFIGDDGILNILWEDVSYYGIPSNLEQLSDALNISTELDDTFEHVQEIKLDGESWNDLSSNVVVS